MITSVFKFYTWVDVLEYFLFLKTESQWPDELLSVRVYWDGITLHIKPKKKLEILQWLKTTWDPRFIEESESILLVDDKTELKFYFDEDDEENKDTTRTIRPTLTNASTVYKKDDIPSLKAFSEVDPQIYAFHSFKGGVGRTLHAIALAKEIVNAGGKVLLIDADFEAPGISYLVFPNIDISYADFLALVHSDENENATNTIELVASKLLNQRREKDIFILPAFRSESQFANLDVKPDDIILNYKNGYILPELLMSIAKILGVDAVIVDLRAGLSELSAGFLLDPRVVKVLVTTLSSQSIEGTKQVLKLIANSAKEFSEIFQPPNIILTQIPDDTLEQDLITKVESDFSDSYIDENRNIHDGDSLIDNLNFIESAFLSELLVLPKTWESVMERITRVNLPEKLRDLVPEIKKILPIDNSINWDSRRQLLNRFTDKMIFAESGKVDTFFWTTPLISIASDYSNKNPFLVVIGPKGSGKTLVFFELMRSQTWGEFVSKSKITSEYSSQIVPILEPSNTEGEAKTLIKNSREQISLSLDLPFFSEHIMDYIRDCLSKNFNESQWRDAWLNAIAYSCGYGQYKEGNPGREFIEFLKKKGKKIVAVFDGIEDLFQDIEGNSEQQKAIRTLIYELPNWLEQQPETPIGIVVLIRRDFVDISIKQNKDQFISKYSPYALKWNLDEALRLAGFITQKSLGFPHGEIESMSRNALLSSLDELWGRRLSYASSREAHSANWIFTALSDWNGQIQARDLVRFLKTASEFSLKETSGIEEKNKNRVEDRVLTIQAIKRAVAACSESKVSEVSHENQVLNSIFKKIKEITTPKKTPINSLSDLGLNNTDVTRLISEGVFSKKVTEGKEEYHIAEIYRSGLNFDYTGKKMTKLLAYRKAFEM